MKTKRMYITSSNIDIVSGSQFSEAPEANRREVDKLRRILKKSVSGELTHMQRYCLTEYFINGKKQREIAKELGVAPSSVCRHISKAVKRLQNIASYYN